MKIKDRDVFPNPPPKISLNIIKNFSNLKVNDVIAFRAMLQPPKAKEFPDDFDFNFDAKFKKIGAYGFVIGEAKIMREAEISRFEDWFLFLREKIRSKISTVISGDEAAMISAFLIGDQNQISKDMMSKIRNSGLAHLLSISGFHLSLASAICFVVTRFILSRREYLALHFDLKKIAAIAAIFGTYFYLKIAASPLPAQRAFVMVILVLIALFVGEKINSKRAVMTAAFALILLNPYAVFNISFQLTFTAILILVSCENLKKSDQDENFLWRFLRYFWQIILISILIQIATAPFLIRSFQNVTLLGFVANILAIPLASFVVMPLGFLALFLMIFGAEKYCLILMSKAVFLIEKIAVFVADLNFSSVASPAISSFGIVLAIIGLLLICLTQSRLRFLGVTLFLLSFSTAFINQKPDILFEGRQKFFAINGKDGLVFSKNLRPSKQREHWMKKFGEVKFKSLKNNPQKEIFCDEAKCLIKKNQKILVLLKRNKTSEICQNDFDVIVNLTSKYKLPECITESKIKIDNINFYQKGGHFFYLKNGNLQIETTS
ncbi:MAG: ComEC/Rec2 family competence protein [Proteobacteria bacterium]|nr:ComEC/Rec2 family competence protein [Pseudomonadota bacterium]